MFKTFLTICLLVLSCATTLAQGKLTSQELDQLDKEITQKYLYDKIKEFRIDSLKKQINSSPINTQTQFEALFKLGKEYETFISDSALYYFDKALRSAQSMNDSTKTILTRLCQVKCYAILGYFKEGCSELDKLEASGIPDEVLPEWLDTNRQLYAYMATYAKDNEELFDTYFTLLNKYRDLQLKTLDTNSPEYQLFLAEHFAAQEQTTKAKLLFSELIEKIPNNNNIYARAAHNMATIKKHEKQDDVAAHYLALAAISDIKCSVKETMAIQDLAIYLYNKGDITRAYKYISSSLADAVFCNARLRTAEVSKIIPLIDGTYKDQLNQQQKALVLTNLFIGVLFIGLIIIIVIMLRQIEKVKTARQQLKEANSIKEEYIGHFLDICSIYMDRLDNFSKLVTRKITAGQVEELLKMAKTNKFTEGQHQQFYDNFDATFLHIYPSFIDEFNKLLLPGEQIIVKEPGHLTTELRIFAFLRMGIEDSNKIAGFLNYSVNTIYTYRNKIKNKAKNRDTFEKDVMNIGSFS